VRRSLLIFAALVAAVVLFALRLAPASLADARIAAMTKDAVHLTDVEGTLWNASGTIAAGATRMPIAWRIDATPLLRGELRLQLVRGDGDSASMPKGAVAIRRDAVALRDIDATIPAGLFAAATIGSGSGVAGGDVAINAASVEWTPSAMRGDARIRWLGAWITVPGSAAPTALGDITAALSGNADPLSGPITNAGGDLAIQGTLTCGAQSGVQLSLVLTPRRADDRNLAQALSMIGAPEGAGWRVEWRLPLR
jgi:hypothetical protein